MCEILFCFLTHWIYYIVSPLHVNLRVVNFQRWECEDLMELEARRKDEERQEKEEPKRFLTQEMVREFCLFEEALGFLGTRSKCRMVHKVYSSHSECNLVPPCYLWWEKKKELLPRCLLLRRKATTNLDSVLKSRDITCRQRTVWSKLWFFQ